MPKREPRKSVYALNKKIVDLQKREPRQSVYALKNKGIWSFV